MEPVATTHITIAAAAQILGQTPHDVALLAESGVITAIEHDGRLLVSQPAVLAHKEATP